MNEDEEERLANKAGFSFVYGFPPAYRTLFPKYVSGLIRSRKIPSAALLETVSERMLEYIMAGMLPTKESAAALGILLELALPEMQRFLGQAGYVLSRSLPNDMIVMWMMRKENAPRNGLRRLLLINEMLDECGLPLLMTRRINEPGS